METTEKNKNQYRQGDVFIERVDSLPGTGLSPIAREGGRIIIAHGTATGHHHAISEPGCELYAHDGSATPQNPGGHAYLKVDGPTATVSHEEHGPISLATGVYKITRQREYSPAAIRNVAD